MLLLSRIIVAEIILVVAHCVDSNVVNGGDDNSRICCVHENCSYSSLDQCLANLTSNILINITTDVTLSSLIRASNLSHVSIIGHDYPTVNCKSVGGIHFQFCHNCTIQGITWDGCGSPFIPGLKFSYSSNVSIQNCTFQRLLGQAMKLRGVLGDVTICDCKFTNNNDYMGHGAAIQFSSNDTRNSFQYVLTISRCNFSYNAMNSLIYFENARLNFVEAILINSTFYRNQGISLYAINSRIHLIGKSCFQNNSAENGAGIFIKDYSHVIFYKTSITFIKNSAHSRGGAILLTNHSICSFDHNSNVTFNNNYATRGIIYSSASSIVTFKGTSEITFSSNLVRLFGAAIYSADNSYVMFKENTKVILTNNRVISAGSNRYYHGGIIYSLQYSNISFEGNSTTVFSDNFADNGGGIYIYNSCNIFFQENSNTVFGNNAADNGGGIYVYYSNIFFQENSNTVFDSNTAHYGGGGICIRQYSNLSFQENSNTVFSNNAAGDGGGIYAKNTSNILFQENSSTVFSNNTGVGGGGICIEIYSKLSFQENSNTVFSNNTAKYGGGIFIVDSSNTSFQGNSNTIFGNNAAKYGGGIIIVDSSHTSFQGNCNTVFSNNTAYNEGGGIYTMLYSNLSFQGNSNTVFSNNTADNGGSIHVINSSNIFFQEYSNTVFSNNTAYYGGGIHVINSSNIFFQEYSSTVFINNSAYYGGGIHIVDSSNTSFQGNSNTVFSNNAAKYGGGIHIVDSSNTSFQGNSNTVFSNNIAEYGGGIHIFDSSNASFQGNSNTVFSNNAADYGSGIYTMLYSNLSFQGNSNTVFSNNIAEYGGAGIYINNSSNIFFQKISTTVFSNNAAHYTGTIDAQNNCSITFDDNSTVTFNMKFGATFFSDGSSTIKAQGNFSVIFNDHSAKWCNNTCLPYDGNFDSTVIDSDGIVGCNNQRGIYCVSDKCNCKKLEDILHGAIINNYPYLHVNISDDVVVLSSLVSFDKADILIMGHNNPTVLCVNSGRLQVIQSTLGHTNVAIKGVTWIGCGFAKSVSNHLQSTSAVLSISGSDYNSINLTIQNCSFQYSLGQVIFLNVAEIIVNITDSKFENSGTIGNDKADIIFSNAHSSVFTFKNCHFCFNKGINIINIANKYENPDFNHKIYLINSVFCNNKGVAVMLPLNSTLNIYGEVLFENNVAENGAGISIFGSASTVIFGKNSNTTFVNNSVDYRGAAMYLENHATAIFDSNSTVTFANNKATNGIIYSIANSRVIFKGICRVTFSGNSAIQFGSAIYSTDNSHLIFTGNATVMLSNNNVMSYNDAFVGGGGTIFSKYSSYISFEENSNTMFNDNQADFGAAIHSIDYSSIVFKDRSAVSFNNHTVHYCGVLTSVLFSNVTFADHTNVTFNTNTASHTIHDSYKSSAGAICTFQYCNVTFSDNSLVTFISNRADRGGAVLIDESNFLTEKYSTVTFHNNFAWYSSGGALACFNNSNIVIKDNSNVTFDSNMASGSGGAIYSNSSCKITFKDNSTSTFINNTARDNGGALFSSQLYGITFEGNSQVTFANNTSDNGGALSFITFTVTFKDSSKVSFHNNLARQSGGVGCCSNGVMMTEDSVTIRYEDNIAKAYAGALYIDKCKVTFKDTSTSTFTSNNAKDNGGAILGQRFSNIILVDNVTVTFNNNKADKGGALYLDDESDSVFSEFANVSFHRNTASYGAAIFTNAHSNITLTGKSSLKIADNEAMQSGGGGYLNNGSSFIVQENASVIVITNKALHGGGICARNKGNLLFKDNSNASFYNNLASVGGGAIKVLNDSIIAITGCTTINFIDNNAQYGGAIFLETNAVMINNSDKTSVYFISNIAKLLGDSVYQEATWLCKSSCKINRTSGISSEFIATPPNELKFYQPATCIDEDNDMQCKQYYVQNVMLGKEIAIPACVLDYYNHSVHSAQFKVQSEKHPIYRNSGPNQVLISCDQYERVNITGNQSLSKSINFTINYTLNVVLNPNWKHISVNLIVELSPCHPGFWHYPNSLKCECYNANDIVFCSDSSSMIKKGYWFGSVTGKPTVAFCPINYCNFTCCETSNGYYQLSPVRDNQCRSHRSGIACGRCEEGYTLSFDSIECLNVNECTTGQTILVLALILLYWIVIIVAVFSLMRFKVGVGYLNSITYYYSVVDILLNQNWYLSSVLNTTINIISSTAKIIPQYLGNFCFIKNMSGIDQQFIHYIHPVAISLFLAMITVLARRSRRLASFISKGIIHVICYLLLLSYTSVATTSLLLMRPLIFHDVDKVYTYVSPDIEYLHGRHLAYAIVAVLVTIIIVIGLPLLLGLEPFLNSKINFVKIKPLIDQFQGCYKDKYRCFSAYYMICRLVIITIIIAVSSNNFVIQYSLLTVCVITALIHLILKPYSNPLLNHFDGAILHLLILISALSFVEFFDDSDTTVLMGITFVIVTLPLLIFITMSLIINKEKIKKFPSYCYTKCSQMQLRNYNQIPLEEVEDEEEHVSVIDDSRRINATICDV